MVIKVAAKQKPKPVQVPIPTEAFIELHPELEDFIETHPGSLPGSFCNPLLCIPRPCFPV